MTTAIRYYEPFVTGLVASLNALDGHEVEIPITDHQSVLALLERVKPKAGGSMNARSRQCHDDIATAQTIFKESFTEEPQSHMDTLRVDLSKYPEFRQGAPLTQPGGKRFLSTIQQNHLRGEWKMNSYIGQGSIGRPLRHRELTDLMSPELLREMKTHCMPEGYDWVPNKPGFELPRTTELLHTRDPKAIDLHKELELLRSDSYVDTLTCRNTLEAAGLLTESEELFSESNPGYQWRMRTKFKNASIERASKAASSGSGRSIQPLSSDTAVNYADKFRNRSPFNFAIKSINSHFVEPRRNLENIESKMPHLALPDLKQNYNAYMRGLPPPKKGTDANQEDEEDEKSDTESASESESENPTES